jgi:hypothetical protein
MKIGRKPLGLHPKSLNAGVASNMKCAGNTPPVSFKVGPRPFDFMIIRRYEANRRLIGLKLGQIRQKKALAER